MIDAIAAKPEPVLAAHAMYVAEANRMPVLGFYKELFRPPKTGANTPQEIQAGLHEACAVLLDSSMRRVVKKETLAAWEATYPTVFKNAYAVIPRTDSPGCGSQ